MISDDPVISELAGANPVPPSTKPTADDRAEADRVLDRVLAARARPRRRRTMLAPVAGALVVVVVVVVALSLHRSGSGHGGAASTSRLQIVLQAEPTAQQPVVTQAAISREVEIVRERLRSVLHSFSVTAPGANRLVITAGRVAPANRARIVRLVSEPAELYFYDWEANALTPNGKTVASQLQTQDQNALAISQGSGAAPGNPGAGSMNLYSAVTRASKQAPEPSSDNAREGPQYYMFGAPGSTACAAAARAQGTSSVTGTHCLLSGPADNQAEVLAGLPAGVSASQGQTLVVPRGIVVLQAVPASFAHPPSISDPTAPFFVLKDHVSLFGNDITNPQQSTDQSGAPDVTFGFTSNGAKQFRSVTALIAHRGNLVSGLGQTLNQHFAVALDTQLITVPSIDFKSYPDGIPGDNGADITSGFSTQSAKDLATELRYGPLPLHLRLIG